MHEIHFCLKLMFSIFLLCLLADFTFGNAEEADTGLTICDGSEWVKFKDEKCFKLIKKWVTRSDANELCSQEMLQIDSSIPQLATIKSQQEQDYLVNYIYNVSAVKINVWIGAKRDTPNQFVWDDGSDVEFANWIEGGPSQSPERECVEMKNQFARKYSDSSIMNVRENGGDGKWRDVTCDLPNYVICEKSQRWSFGKLQHSFLLTRKEMKDSFELVSKELEETNGNLKSTQNQLSSTQNELSITKSELANTKSQLSNTQNQLSSIQQNPVPIGFIYVQLPGQPEPLAIWPGLGWSEVTGNYAGQFFRAEGGGSSAFGTEQNGDSPRLTSVESQYVANHYTRNGMFSLNPGHWTGFVRSGGPGEGGPHHGIKFLISNTEVRPRNQAVRIWKREH